MKAVELARATGMSEASISKYVSGRRRPSWNVAKKIAAATKTDVDLWMEGDPIDRLRALKAAKNGDEK